MSWTHVWKKKSGRRRLLKARRRQMSRQWKDSAFRGKMLRHLEKVRESPKFKRAARKNLEGGRGYWKEHPRKFLEIQKMGTTASSRAQRKKNGNCDICKKRCKVQRDHDHKTGKARGGLCFNCNMGLGYFKDSRKLLGRAAKYLRNFR